MANGASAARSDRPGPAAAGDRTATVASTRSPALSRWRFGRDRPLTSTRPSSMAPWAAVREPSGPARKRSSRDPSSPGGTLSSSRSPGTDPLGPPAGGWAFGAPPLEHPEQRQHPERDRDISHVEGGPDGELDEVDHRTGGGPVDEVSHRAADQHARGQPQPWPARAEEKVDQQEPQRQQGQGEHERAP